MMHVIGLFLCTNHIFKNIYFYVNIYVWVNVYMHIHMCREKKRPSRKLANSTKAVNKIIRKTAVSF